MKHIFLATGFALNLCLAIWCLWGIYERKWSPREIDMALRECERLLPKNENCILVATPQGKE